MKSERRHLPITTKCLLILLIVLLSNPANMLASSSILNCTFKTEAWNIYDYDRLAMNQTEPIRFCDVMNKEIFVNFVRLEALAAAGNENLAQVQGFSFTQGTMNFFPRGIDRIFPSIAAINVSEAKLREIHVEDLAPFLGLKLLYLNSNEIRVIEADLFKFNEKLEIIRLDFNQISHVDAQVFSHLRSLQYLWLNENGCKTAMGNAVGSRDEVQALIRQVEDEKCSNPTELATISSNNDRILRILDELQDLKSSNNNTQISAENQNLKAQLADLNANKKVYEEKVKSLEAKNENLKLKIYDLEAQISNHETNQQECDVEYLKQCHLELERLNKIIEQLQKSSGNDNKIPWRTILIPSVIGMVTLIVLVAAIVVIIFKINFIIQKLKDQFQNTRRPLNVPISNDFWRSED